MNARWRAPAGLHTASARLPVEGELPSFSGATGWLNSPPLTPAGLRGKVVLVDFWTYTCINWLRQLRALRMVLDEFLVGPAGGRDTRAQRLQFRLGGDRDRERPDRRGTR